ncbi:MATE efflux family protein [Carbonactinospora thermoautotrophica]|uniref:MATE efflux family protein n=1 Tax=Carbonactinospora thermoautotrophica TaxID=1469144 RepID=A0A132MKN7_9ACTN|nr:MATE family efflux transporter [Carbonactinospora thermoautotrophica]KWW98432.1 MATE efflux family protein [Carbonactinospora thermoautotrophica]
MQTVPSPSLRRFLPAARHPHDREIWRLALPAFGALVAEPLFLLVDSAIVGHLGTPQLAGLGVAATALGTLAYVCVFLAYGTTAGVARQLGAGNVAAAIRQGLDGIWLATVLGFAILAAGAALTPRIVALFDPAPSAVPYAEQYLRISLLGVPGMLVVLAATGVLRGLQDTRTPLLVAVVGFTVNAALNALLVYPAGLGVAGSALGTVLAQTGMAAAYLVVVVRGARRHGASLRPDWPGVRQAMAAGVPLVIRTLSLRVVLVVATAVAARLGNVALAGHQIAANLWTMTALALDAVAIAGQAIVGRYLGAGDVAGTREATRRMVEWGVASGVGLGLLLVVARPAYVPLFTEDAAVRAALAAAVVVMAVLQPVSGAVFVLDGVLIGAGDGRFLAVAAVLTTAVFLPAAWAVLAFGGTLASLWWAMGLWMVARLVTLGVRASGTAWMVTGAVRR